MKALKQIDEKFDDGKYNAGEIRTKCVGINDSGNSISTGYASYEQSIDAINNDKNGYCNIFYYYLGF